MYTRPNSSLRLSSFFFLALFPREFKRFKAISQGQGVPHRTARQIVGFQTLLSLYLHLIPFFIFPHPSLYLAARISASGARARTHTHAVVLSYCEVLRARAPWQLLLSTLHAAVEFLFAKESLYTRSCEKWRVNNERRNFITRVAYRRISGGCGADATAVEFQIVRAKRERMFCAIVRSRYRYAFVRRAIRNINSGRGFYDARWRLRRARVRECVGCNEDELGEIKIPKRNPWERVSYHCEDVIIWGMNSNGKFEVTSSLNYSGITM